MCDEGSDTSTILSELLEGKSREHCGRTEGERLFFALIERIRSSASPLSQ